jgi:hypothetical protein
MTGISDNSGVLLGTSFVLGKKLTVNMDEQMIRILFDQDCSFSEEVNFSFKGISLGVASSYLGLLLVFVLAIMGSKIALLYSKAK